MQIQQISIRAFDKATPPTQALELLIRNNLYPVPIWADELRIGDSTLAFQANLGNILVTKRGAAQDEFEISKLPNQSDNITIAVVTLSEAVKRGWLNCPAPSLRKPPLH